MTVAVTTLSLRQLYIAYNDDKINLANAEILYYYIGIVAVILTYILQLVRSNEIKTFVSQVPLLELMDYFELNQRAVKSSIVKIVVKTLLFPIILEINLIIRQRRKDTVINLFPLVASNFLPNCVFSALVICYHYMQALNSYLEKVEKDANLYQDVKQMILHKPFHRMQAFCNMADKLDELSEKYSIICKNILKYVEINSVAILAALLCNLFAITGGLFQQYNALADTLINKESYDLFDAMTNGVFLAIAIADIALYGSMANDCLEMVQETSIILKRIQLNNCDIRFRQSVERFSLQIFVENFKIQPMGMLEINVGLLHDVLSAVTSFLLILIQSDLTLRFSLK
ncbi:putative gustatory receptor 94a [Musca vetustissima]|uniref:putative gustatory receptor 94a n=1 Tax=Musca vetustissima TaxID=27455 RepID=UPI002AB7AEAE|nr:putative gustatory receptor 94a [Musca vetustissima]